MARVQLQGQEFFEAPHAIVLEKLADLSFLANSVPEAQLIEATANRTLLHLPPGVTMLPGRLQVELLLLKREGCEISYRIVNRATGATGTAEVKLMVAELSSERTQVAWTAEVVQVTGLLRMMPNSVLKAGLERAIPHVWSRIRTALVG